MSLPLEEIGFYTLSDARRLSVTAYSPMVRCELIITKRCNFRCIYCRGAGEEMDWPLAKNVLRMWAADGLQNVRFSGGEPTLVPWLPDLVKEAKELGVGRVAISTNGTARPSLYRRLVRLGADDFSVSLDACCASTAQTMSGVVNPQFARILENIRWLASAVYTTVGIVLTRENSLELKDTIELADSLHVADIRVIGAAQDGSALKWPKLRRDLLKKYPILRYRYIRAQCGSPVRGIDNLDSPHCLLTWDDSLVCGKYHYPCVIYFREGGDPIGRVSQTMRKDRIRWSQNHDSLADPICRNNCLDVCVAYNNGPVIKEANRVA